MSDVKVLFSGRGHDQDLKTTQKKRLLECIVRKPFSLIILSIYTSYKGKRKSPINCARFYQQAIEGKYLGDLTTRIVKEKTQKPEGLTLLRYCTRSVLNRRCLSILSIFVKLPKLGHILRSGFYPKQVIAFTQSPLTYP